VTIITKRSINELINHPDAPKDADAVDVRPTDWTTPEGCIETMEHATVSFLMGDVDHKSATLVIDAANKAANIRLRMSQKEADKQVDSLLRRVLSVPGEVIDIREGNHDEEFRLLNAKDSSGHLVPAGPGHQYHGPPNRAAGKVAAD
jgi:hypothetical protein